MTMSHLDFASSAVSDAQQSVNKAQQSVNHTKQSVSSVQQCVNVQQSVGNAPQSVSNAQRRRSEYRKKHDMLPRPMPIKCLVYHFRDHNGSNFVIIPEINRPRIAKSEGLFQCPEDKSPLDYAKIYPDQELQDEIQASMVRCLHHIEGCKWTDRLSNLKAHLEVCAYNPVPCPNDCSALVARICIDDHLEFTCSHRRRVCDLCGQEFAGDMYDTHEGNCQYEVVWCENKCGAKLQRRFLGNHMKNECHKRLANCRFCQKEFLFETLQTHQYSCPRYPIPCPNRCEPVKIPREEIDSHINECCPSATIPCMFKEYGCQHKCPRFNLERHLDDNTKGHLTMMCKQVRRQQQQINALRAKVNNLSQVTDGVFIWKISDYKLKLAEARSKLGLEIMSEPFYTSRYGYKLIASAFLNGNGSGEGKYFSLYIKLLPGEYDNLLEWPFKLPVSFFLIDQTSKLDSRTDIMESFVPDPSWKHFQKPGKEDNSLGFGYPKFVPHETIRTRHYLKEDSLFVKIEVDTSRMCPL